MKNVVIFLVFLFLGQSFAQFKLNKNPQNPSRMPNPNTEYGIILSHDSPTITIGGGNGKESTNHLVAGTLVIVNKQSQDATWIAICGNDVLTKWKPEGKRIDFYLAENYKNACDDMNLMLSKLDNLQEGVNELLKRPNLSIQKLRLALKESFKNDPIPTPESPSSWTTGKTLGVVGATIGGALIGGFCFQKTEIHQKIKIIPGVIFWTGEGTRQQTPDKMEVIETTSKKFNPGAAALGAAAGFISSFLVFYF
jgi:hypothetical protein